MRVRTKTYSRANSSRYLSQLTIMNYSLRVVNAIFSFSLLRLYERIGWNSACTNTHTHTYIRTTFFFCIPFTRSVTLFQSLVPAQLSYALYLVVFSSPSIRRLASLLLTECMSMWLSLQFNHIRSISAKWYGLLFPIHTALVRRLFRRPRFESAYVLCIHAYRYGGRPDTRCSYVLRTHSARVCVSKAEKKKQKRKTKQSFGLCLLRSVRPMPVTHVWEFFPSFSYHHVLWLYSLYPTLVHRHRYPFRFSWPMQLPCDRKGARYHNVEQSFSVYGEYVSTPIA